ncbi:MAG: hypothetical protein KKH67_00945 [candidate division Zixibacteria bacterium]|nr:hypothetical protein [candidate division Zixibacteria bacterium]MBU1471306.1 hypothetical protein [candidate division Zixibacteria bacterium]
MKISPEIIQLARPSDCFEKQIIANCGKTTLNSVRMCAETLGIEPDELMAMVEVECQSTSNELGDVERGFREQVRKFVDPESHFTPFEGRPDYLVFSSLQNVISKLLPSIPDVEPNKLYEVIRMHDPLYWLVPRKTRPDHVLEVPLRNEIDDWLGSEGVHRRTTHTSMLTCDSVVAAEIEVINSEHASYWRMRSAILINGGVSVESISPDVGSEPFINPGWHRRTIQSLRDDYAGNTLVMPGTPLFSYQSDLWILQGPYRYLRLYPRIAEDLNLTWRRSGAFDMGFEGEEAVRFVSWRDGYVPDRYSRAEEHSGCFTSCSLSLLHEITARYGLDIVIVEHEVRTRKRERWQNGREEKSVESTRIELLEF